VNATAEPPVTHYKILLPGRLPALLGNGAVR